MATSRILARVGLTDGVSAVHDVGVVEDRSGRIAFQYQPAFVASARSSISPILLPLANRPFTFPSLQGSEAFHGLPGVLADSLPDRFGTRVMDAYFRSRGQSPEALSPIQRLLYVGDRAMGALTYSPSEPTHPQQALPLTLALLRDQARAAIRGETNAGVLREIMAAASSAGGMRAKALLNWDRTSNDIVYGTDAAKPGYEPWLVKFDGTGTDAEPQHWCRLEYAYMQMARNAGIATADVCLIEDGPYRHFAARRFDRTPAGRRLHMVSLCGLQHVDFNEPGLIGYETLLDTCHHLRLGATAIAEAYRRMVFNVLARNQDDHTKNIAFLMDPASFEWRLSPAFDITYANGAGYTRTHQMTINGKVSDIEREDLLAIATRYGIRHPQRIIDDVADAVHAWPELARELDIPEPFAREIQAAHRLDLAVSGTPSSMAMPTPGG